MYLASFSVLWRLSPFFLMLSGLAVVMSPVVGDTVNVELSMTAEVTENAQSLADCSLMSYLWFV